MTIEQTGTQATALELADWLEHAVAHKSSEIEITNEEAELAASALRLLDQQPDPAEALDALQTAVASVFEHKDEAG